MTFQGLKHTMSDFSDISEFRGPQKISAFLLSKNDFARLGGWSHDLVHEGENGEDLLVLCASTAMSYTTLMPSA